MQRRLLARLLTGFTAVAGAVALSTGPAAGGAGTVLVVDTTVDDGSLDACTDAADDCSLRGALEKVTDDHADGVTIEVQVPAGEYVLADQLYLYQANVVVSGAGVGETIVSVDEDSEDSLIRHLELNTDGELDVTLTDMTFTGGNGDQDEPAGGSILSRGGADLTLQRMHFVANEVRGDGGAVAAYGNPQIETLVIEDTTFVGNRATGMGGAVLVADDESATITNSTFTDNHAAFGGALFVGTFDAPGSASASLTHVTLAGNTASGLQGDASIAGGAIGVGDGADVTLEGTVVEGSSEGEAVVPVAVGDPVANCYVADGGALASAGYNVVDDDTCGLTEDTDQPDTAAGVQALGDNGGPTFTMALLASSPAVDAAGATCAVTDDQRGTARPQDGNADGTNGCDSGAFELAADEEPPPAAQPVAGAPSFAG
jgi:hypothetical protein